MKINFIWFIVILSWTLFLYHIIMPFTGIVEREWSQMSFWSVLSIVWTSILVDAKEEETDKEENNKKEK